MSGVRWVSGDGWEQAMVGAIPDPVAGPATMRTVHRFTERAFVPAGVSTTGLRARTFRKLRGRIVARMAGVGHVPLGDLQVSQRSDTRRGGIWLTVQGDGIEIGGTDGVWDEVRAAVEADQTWHAAKRRLRKPV